MFIRRQSRTSGNWWRALRDLTSSRLFAATITVVMLFWRAGWDVNSNFVNGVVGAVILYAMLHTRTGRGLFTMGWLMMLGAAIVGFFYLGVSRERFEALGIVLAWGAMFFVDWRSLSRQIAGGDYYASAARRRPAPRQANKKTPHIDCTVGWRHPGMR